MAPMREKSNGGVWLPDVASGKYRPNVGVVLVSGEASYKPGDVVLVRPYDGYWLDGYKGKHYQTDREIRWFGLALDLEESGRTITWDVCDQIVGWFKGGKPVPGPGYSLVRRNKETFAVETSIQIWADTGEALEGTYSGEVAFQAGHPDDLLHVQWTQDEDLWLVPDRCMLAKVTYADRP